MPHERLTSQEVQDHFDALGGAWEKSGDEIGCDYKFQDFKAAMHFVNQVADLAEKADHHPDILIHGWNNVRITLSTHSAGGLTMKDFNLARQIDGLLR